MMRRFAFALFALLALAVPAAAQTQGESPIKITADVFVVDDETKLATFTGSVVVVRKDMTVWAAKVVVDYGEGGPSNIKSFVATGNVRIKTNDQDATGDRAVYDPKAETLKLTGNVMVVNASSTVGGPDLLIDLNANTTTFTGGRDGRVTGVFTPQ
ncbi:MAG: lipopolysaccharide transport periplasmic protein LptA [Hyphomicrobiales bacterium]|nr:MAG: lipopolysaccharide transport periplasmic protein LptA [Hyphomicrobiales bacterium]